MRLVWGRDPGVGWGLACVAAGVRWGTLGVGDVQVATRLVAPTVLAGSTPVRIVSAVALAAAIVDEARQGGLRSPGVGERAAGAVALAALVPLFLAPGSGSLVALGWWGAAAAVAGAAVLMMHPLATRLPPWPIAAVAGAAVVALGIVR